MLDFFAEMLLNLC